MPRWLVWAALMMTCAPLAAQDRDTKVRNDKKAFEGSTDWIYNDLAEGQKIARESNKPLMVVFRCIPCKACAEFDDDVARRNPVIRDLLDDFVCVRIVQANTIDLAHFQYDFDQSFAIVFTSPDLFVYGRYGTRSERPEHQDVALEGLRKGMERVLKLHAAGEDAKKSLAGKQPQETKYKTPLEFPSLAGKYGKNLDYAGATAKSCIHCHQVGEAQRRVYRDAGQPIPDDVLFPYPDPAVIGLKLDSAEVARIERVEAGSLAEKAGLRVGDELASVAGQPLTSIADVQWVLHTSAEATELPLSVVRDGKTINVNLALPAGWRRGDISWRATTWDLRRAGLGGMRLNPMTAEERSAAKLSDEAIGLRIHHVGEYGEHAVAKNAGFQKGDVIVKVDDLSGPLTETQVLAYTLQKKSPGEKLEVTLLRNGAQRVIKYALPK